MITLDDLPFVAKLPAAQRADMERGIAIANELTGKAYQYMVAGFKAMCITMDDTTTPMYRMQMREVMDMNMKLASVYERFGDEPKTQQLRDMLKSMEDAVVSTTARAEAMRAGEEELDRSMADLMQVTQGLVAMAEGLDATHH
jgi:hypothetical protein